MYITSHDREEGAGWISATEAKQMAVAISLWPPTAQGFLIRRAGAGMLATRCARIEIAHSGRNTTSSRHDNVLVDPEFWRKFENASQRRIEDWAAGDFEWSAANRWHPGEIVRLFGVQFARTDLLRGLPAPEPVERISSMTNGEVEEWCRQWLSGQHGNTKPSQGMDKAWPMFAALPQALGLSRDDVFRPAFRKAKTSQ